MRLSYLSLLPVLFVVACAPMSQAPNISDDMAMKEAEIQREIVLKDTYKNFDRLQKVAQPILLANAPICGDKIAPYIGVNFGSIDEMPQDYRNTMQRLYGIQKQPTVYHVTEKSPAAGKLKTGDMLVSMNGEKINSGVRGMRQLEKLLNEEDTSKLSSFIIDRGGKEQTVSIQPKTACAGRALLQNNPQINAFADGENMYVTSGMMGFAKSDNELALVLGHELAHNSRKHVESKQGNQLIGILLGAVVSGVTGVNVTNLGGDLGGMAFSQGFEGEADYVGLYHTARGGYNVTDAPHFWRRMGAMNPQGIHLAGSSHPSTAKRFIALEAAAKEVQGKKSRGQSLVPQERKQEEYKREMGQLNQ